MLWLAILCVILFLIVIFLCIKIITMRQATKEIAMEFSDRLKNDTNTLISISSHDKQLCQLANSINQQLRELRKERHRFQQGDLEIKTAITNISHDLRTPLTAICGYLDLLAQEEKSETVSRYLATIENRTTLLKKLTEELFCYSIVASTLEEKGREEVVLNSLLEESISAYYGALVNHNITPLIIIPEERIKRQLNKNATSRIFSNIISNAIKYSDGDLTIMMKENGEIEFSNTAAHLSEVQVQRLFDRFYTVETGEKSTGLGLSIAKVLTEKMGGTITAEYQNDQLSIFLQF